jgi:hypothetical protein
LKEKKIGGAKIRKNNKFWGKILIFLIFLIFWENLGAWGGQAPPSPKVAPPLLQYQMALLGDSLMCD